MGTTQLHVDSSNVEQANAWEGDEGRYWAAHAEHFDRSLAAYHRRFVDAAAIQSADRVLDIGCGTGQTTRDAARAAPRGEAVGVDLSSEMLEVARRLAVSEGVANARFEHADAQIHFFEPQSFDVAISRTSAMFFGDLVAAFRNIARALRPGGHLVLLTWQPLPGNEWIGELSTALAAGRDLRAPPPDAPGPFALAVPDRVHTVLAKAGFVDVSLESIERPMWFGTDADDAYTFVLGLLGWMLEGADEGLRARALDGLRATVGRHETVDGVLYRSSAWLIRAHRP